MDLKNLQEIIQKGETETLEFKKSTSVLNAVGQTLCGFLNGKGGKVLIGISSEKKIVGQNVSDNTLREIAELIKKIEPPSAIDLDRIEVESNREVIMLTAYPRRADAPYVFCGRPYQRLGSTTSMMPQHIYHRLLMERNHDANRWENQISVDYTIDDLDSEEVLRTLRLGKEVGRLPEHQGENIPSILDRLELRKNGQLTYAAIVLFGKRFIPQFMQCQLRLARFKGIDKMEFMDQKEVYGNAFHLFEEAMMFLRRHLPVAGKIIPGILERKDEPLFPLAALREALVNAICHRDHSHPGGAISIAVFDNRLEFWNDGTLPFGLTPADLKKEHASRQRNPVIANVFYNRGLIEKWGRGTQKIVDLCVKAGHPEPEFLEQAGSFVTRFVPSSYVAPHRISHDLTDRQRSILQALAHASGTGNSFTEVKDKLSDPPPDRTLRDDFQHLKRLGLIDFVGHAKTARWRLITPDE